MIGDVSEIKRKSICTACTSDTFLKHEIAAKGTKRKCSYCKRTRKSMHIEDFADYIEVAFEDHYERTSNDHYPYDEPEGESIAFMIQEAAEIDERPAEDVRAVLEDRHRPRRDRDSLLSENPFSSEAHYQSKGVRISEYLEEWDNFRKSILTEARMFNSKAEAVLARIFEGLEDHVTVSGKKVIVSAGPGERIKTLYRARAFQSDAKLETAIGRPDIELGPPPGSPVGGRMNSRGIGVFYGATHPAVALAEIRPPVGSRVLVARFEIIRPLRLLDLDAMRSIQPKGSIFEPSFVHVLEKAAFLDSMSERITRPVMPDDEASEYLVTQAIADYLAMRRDSALDGIIYPSAQQSGKTKRNVVLFHKSARVESLEPTKHIKITAHVQAYDEDGRRPDYVVFVSRAPKKEKATTSYSPSFAIRSFLNLNAGVHYDTRQSALHLDVASLKVYHVNSVKFSATYFPVVRHESEMTAQEVKQMEDEEEKLKFE